MATMSEIIQNGFSFYDSNEKVEIEKELNSFYESGEYRNWDSDGRQPLHIASMLGRLNMVGNLLKQGVDINCTDRNACTALHYSAERGKLDIVKYLLRENAAINQQNNYGQTALILAVIYGHKDVVEYLCSKNADIHIEDKRSKTALYHARERSETEILQILEKYDTQT